MTKRKSPHTQSQQNTPVEQADLEADESGLSPDDPAYNNMDGAESGGTRSPRRIPVRGTRHRTEPQTEAREGSVYTRTPKSQVEGITSHSSDEESARQEKVVSDRPDAEAGVNHSK
jgi:hypothetical protein